MKWIYKYLHLYICLQMVIMGKVDSYNTQGFCSHSTSTGIRIIIQHITMLKSLVCVEFTIYLVMMATCHLLSWALGIDSKNILFREYKKDKHQHTHEEREVSRSKRKDKRTSSWKRKLSSYLPAAEILEEKIQGGSPHHSSGHDAEEWDGKNLLRAPKLLARNRCCQAACTAVWAWGTAQLPAPRLPSWWCKRPGRAAGCRWRCPACRKQSPGVDRSVQRGHWAQGGDTL